MALAPSRAGRLRLRRGDTVEVRRLPEILATLDADGKLDGMPFMPEMAEMCGRRFTVFRRAEKTCVEGHRMRRLDDTVLLDDVRCDGGGHDGCQRRCLIFWKTAWLKPVDGSGAAEQSATATAESGPIKDIAALPTKAGDRYICQSTELARASRPISRWNPWPYVGDLFIGEMTFGQFVRMIARMASVHLRRLLRRMPGGQRRQTPRGGQRLQAGEWVTVKGAAEIEATLDVNGKNRGLSFEIEMLDHCGQRRQVGFPVERIILEETGKMLELSETVALDSVICRGTCAKNCPRANYYFWRELWLERTEAPRDGSAEGVRR